MPPTKFIFFFTAAIILLLTPPSSPLQLNRPEFLKSLLLSAYTIPLDGSEPVLSPSSSRTISKDRENNERKGVPRYGKGVEGGIWNNGYDKRELEFPDPKVIRQTIVPGREQSLYEMKNPVRKWW
mmetsp:Transcript_23807/g.49604  ORF Transcript_23807/g.49604 Transcript_23807/m.49604 type:complete len:125 (-) Transcript_23807:5-379(-)